MEGRPIETENIIRVNRFQAWEQPSQASIGRNDRQWQWFQGWEWSNWTQIWQWQHMWYSAAIGFTVVVLIVMEVENNVELVIAPSDNGRDNKW